MGLAAVVFGTIALAVTSTVQSFFPAANSGVYPPQCGTGHSVILAAQAVASAALVPCVAALPPGWSVGGADIASGHAKFWLDSDHAGPQAVTITLSATCDTSGARQIPSHQPQTRRFERPLSLRPQFTDLRFYIFPGGSATYWFHFARGASPLLAIAADGAVDFTPRARLVTYIEKPRAWRYAGAVRHARDKPAGGGPGAGASGAGPVVIDLMHRRRSLTRPSLGDPHSREKRTGRTNVTSYGTRCGPREMGTRRRLRISDEFASCWPSFRCELPAWAGAGGVGPDE